MIQSMFEVSMWHLNCESNPEVTPFTSASASVLPDLGDHSTCALMETFFMNAASSMMIADAGNLVDIRRLSAAPLPLLSVHVGTTVTSTRCR